MVAVTPVNAVNTCTEKSERKRCDPERTKGTTFTVSALHATIYTLLLYFKSANKLFLSQFSTEQRRATVHEHKQQHVDALFPCFYLYLAGLEKDCVNKVLHSSGFIRCGILI